MRWSFALPMTALAALVTAARGQEAPVVALDAQLQAVEALEGSSGIALSDNRELRRQLDLIRKQFESRKFTDAVRVAGSWLEDPHTEDFFLNSDTGDSAGRSFKSELRAMLSQLPAEGRDECQLLFGPAAQALLAEAITRGGGSAFQAIALRYGHTRAGQEAFYRLGEDHWNHGRPREAAVCWQRLKQSPEVAVRFEPLLSVMLAASWRRVGESDKAQQVLVELRRQHPAVSIAIAGRQRVAMFNDDSQALTWLASVVPAALETGGQTNLGQTLLGLAARNPVVPAQPPLLSPRWYGPVTSDTGARQAIDGTLEDIARNGRTWLPTIFPLAVGNVVIRHTGQLIEALDFQTGATLWDQPSEAYGNGGSLDQRLWHEAAFGRLVTDGQRLYVVERDASEPIVPDPDASEAVVPQAGFNALSARDIAEPRQGNLRWRVGGSDGGDEPSLAEALFLGPPLPIAGRLYVLAEVKQAIRLVVLDAVTGRLEWSQELASVEPEQMIGALRRAAGTSPSIADEVVVCPTSGGGVVAVDLVTQSLLWAYRYACSTPTRTDPDHGVQADLGQGSRWLDGGAMIADGRVIVTPLESQHIHCLELETGRPQWRQPRGDNLYAACLHEAGVVLVGKSQVSAWKLADGRPAWSKPLALPKDSHPSGRGVYAGGHYYLPLSTAEILQIDLATGRIVGTSRSLKQIVPGNLVWHRGAFLSSGTRFLEVFDELAPLAQQMRERLEQSPSDAVALARLGEIELTAGNVGQALAQLRKAHEFAPTPRHRNLLAAALQDGLRGNPPDRKKLEEELDRLLER